MGRGGRSGMARGTYFTVDESRFVLGEEHSTLDVFLLVVQEQKGVFGFYIGSWRGDVSLDDGGPVAGLALFLEREHELAWDGEQGIRWRGDPGLWKAG